MTWGNILMGYVFISSCYHLAVKNVLFGKDCLQTLHECIFAHKKAKNDTLNYFMSRYSASVI